MAFIDYYKILGVNKDIPQNEVRAAYRKRAKQFHPDLHPDDPKAKAKFQALSEAYDVISDPEKRRKYDQYGEHWREAGAAGTGAGGAGDYKWSSSDSAPFRRGRRLFKFLSGPFREYGRQSSVTPIPGTSSRLC